MTTQNLIKGIMILVAVIGFGLTGCKKEKIENIASLQQLATDETDIQNGAEDVLNDANDVLSRGQTKELSSLPCGATIDSLIVNDTITYTLTFNGLNCNGNRYRTGQVKITRNVNDHWSTAGTTIRVEFINYRITRVLRNRTETLNGRKIRYQRQRRPGQEPGERCYYCCSQGNGYDAGHFRQQYYENMEHCQAKNIHRNTRTIDTDNRRSWQCQRVQQSVGMGDQQEWRRVLCTDCTVGSPQAGMRLGPCGR